MQPGGSSADSQLDRQVYGTEFEMAITRHRPRRDIGFPELAAAKLSVVDRSCRVVHAASGLAGPTGCRKRRSGCFMNLRCCGGAWPSLSALTHRAANVLETKTAEGEEFVRRLPAEAHPPTPSPQICVMALLLPTGCLRSNLRSSWPTRTDTLSR